MIKIDISEYLGEINSPNDKKLFNEAVLAANIGALRASYIMIWICCAESIKRRFEEAKARDNKAQKISSTVKQKEKNHESVDVYLLRQTLDYGLIDDTEYNHLFTIYQNRCIFGHPYEISPLPEQVKVAAAEAVTYILSKPLKLRHGYMESIINHFLNVHNYIDNLDETISPFAEEVFQKVDEKLYGWFIDKFTTKLEKIENDATMNKIRYRAYNFITAFLKKTDLKFLSDNDWHDFVMKHEKSSLHIFLDPILFSKLYHRSTDFLIGSSLLFHESRTICLLNDLCTSKKLSQRQIDKIKNLFNDKDVPKETAVAIRNSGVNIYFTFDIVIHR